MKSIVALMAAAGSVFATFMEGDVTAPCDSLLFCRGELLKQIELARPFEDSKTFVDLPTIKPLDQVLAAFDRLTKPLANDTALQAFLKEYFGQPGGEIAEVTVELDTNPTFLDHVNASVVAAFVEQVIGIWPTLTRDYVGGDKLCNGCVSSFLPVNRTFVVAGGRFREPYYWDSFFIIEGLVRTKGAYTQIARNIIENFLDYVEQFGFVPNGGRAYYLNRSQPPLLTQMVRVYIEATNDTSILQRALPLLDREQEFWRKNNTLKVSRHNKTYTLSHYSVLNNQPRPESYLEDYITANNESYVSKNGSTYPVRKLNETEKADLYADLASGAESGWDYSSRWLKRPLDSANENYTPLQSLNTRQIIPVDLNSILYQNEAVLAGFYALVGNHLKSRQYAATAYRRQQGMYELMYNESMNGYFDFNTSSNSQNTHLPTGPNNGTLKRAFSAAQYYPYWTGAAHPDIMFNATILERLYRPIREELDATPGGIGATNLRTGQQWDTPNVWPPLQYIIMQGALSASPSPSPSSSSSLSEDCDPAWISLQATALELAQRFLDSTFCTWRATGGSIPELGIMQLSGSNPNAMGTIFEKYNVNATDAVGGGGEYQVVPGFGWSNGVLIWVADVFGDRLKEPQCGDISAVQVLTKRDVTIAKRGVY